MEHMGAEGIQFGPPPCPLSHHPGPPRWGGACGEGGSPESMCSVGMGIAVPSAPDSWKRQSRLPQVSLPLAHVFTDGWPVCEEGKMLATTASSSWKTVT